MIRYAVLSAAAIVSLAPPAGAQDGAMWVSDRGNMLLLQFSGGAASAGVAPKDRAPGDMANAFKRLCVDTGSRKAAMDAIAQADGLVYGPFTLPATKKAAEVVMPIWRIDGLVVSQTDGFFSAPTAQCNATFYIVSPPDRQAVQDAMSSVMGKPPLNIALATKKNGEPAKYYSPEWAVTGADASSWIASVTVSKDSPSLPGNRVQITLRASKQKAQ